MVWLLWARFGVLGVLVALAGFMVWAAATDRE
jgi:hypothetical protein